MLGILLLILTNIGITITLTLILKVFGITITNSFLLFAIIFGFAGSLFSLFISKWVAKTTTNAVIISNPSNNVEHFLFNTIYELSTKAGIGMPEIAIYEGDVNAFATGWNKNNALVAVSTGLLNNMEPEEIKAVLGHEISHIKNGDMITMTLLQGVINTFVIIATKIISTLISKEEKQNLFLEMIIQIPLSFLGAVIAMWFSRFREYKADEMSSQLYSPNAMINALERLRNREIEPLPSSIKTFGFVGFFSILSTHPKLEDRIKNLKSKFFY